MHMASQLPQLLLSLLWVWIAVAHGFIIISSGQPHPAHEHEEKSEI
jgi:hypothetical protein